MIELSEEIGTGDAFDFSPTHVIIDQSESMHNGSINGTLDSFVNDFNVSNETMRLLFIAIATITVLVCLTICVSVCVCISLNRRRRFKRQEKKGHLLLPEQSERISDHKSSQIPFVNPLPLYIHSNGKQESDNKNSSSSIQPSLSNIIISKTTRSFYYDNLDDIPFIDESRPTSFIDITRV